MEKKNSHHFSTWFNKKFCRFFEKSSKLSNWNGKSHILFKFMKNNWISQVFQNVLQEISGNQNNLKIKDFSHYEPFSWTTFIPTKLSEQNYKSLGSRFTSFSHVCGTKQEHGQKTLPATKHETAGKNWKLCTYSLVQTVIVFLPWFHVILGPRFALLKVGKIHLFFRSVFFLL